MILFAPSGVSISYTPKTAVYILTYPVILALSKYISSHAHQTKHVTTTADTYRGSLQLRIGNGGCHEP